MVLDLATAVREGFSGVLEFGLGRMEQARAVARVASGRGTLEAVFALRDYAEPPEIIFLSDPNGARRLGR